MPTGVCIGFTPPSPNALGVIILIICISLAVITRTKEAIYLLSTLQSLALISFVEVAWIDPSSYLLQSLQYLMIFNLMARPSKTKDFTMLQRQYYRLHDYYIQS